MRSDLASLVRQRHGHFELESGHHGDLWLDLEALCSNPKAVRPLAAELAKRLRPYRAEVICGPLVEGAFVGLMVADELGLELVYAAPEASSNPSALFPVSYRIPAALRLLEGRRVAIVNDVINAGSAVRGSLDNLAACGAYAVVIGTLLSLGSRPSELAKEYSVPLESLDTEANLVWTPSECPLCAAGNPVTRFPGR